MALVPAYTKIQKFEIFQLDNLLSIYLWYHNTQRNNKNLAYKTPTNNVNQMEF